MYAIVGDRRINYSLDGSGARTLVLIHALGATSAIWQPQIERFKSGYTVIAYEACGHFPETGSTPLTFPRLADDVAGVLDAVGTTSAHLVGISMGGMIALAFALAHADRVDSLTLASTTASYPDENRAVLRERADTVLREGMTDLAEATVQRWLSETFRRGHPDWVENIRAMLAQADPRAYAAAACLVASADFTSDLARVRAPTLVIRGSLDQSLPASGRQLLAAIPGAEEVVIDGSAHLCNVDGAPAFNERLDSFLQGSGEKTTDLAFRPGQTW